jgi:hypothetical protein
MLLSRIFQKKKKNCGIILDPLKQMKMKCDYLYIIYSHKKEWNYAIFKWMDGTGDHHVLQNKPCSDDNGHVFSLMRKSDLYR